MENLITLLGLLFFMFLVLAASVEVILEVFRGVLERFGVSWAQSKVSLDEALKLASEFAPHNRDLTTKLEAIKSVANQVKETSNKSLDTIRNIETELKGVMFDEQGSQIAAKINAVAAEVKNNLAQSERQKVFILRSVAALLGCLIVYLADFHVFRILLEDPIGRGYLVSFEGLKTEWVNVLVGGLAAAAGSSYWHDKLDKVRKIKAIMSETKKV